MLTNTIDILRCSTYVIAKALLPSVFTLIFFQLQPNLEFGMLRQTDSFHQIFKTGFVLMVNILKHRENVEESINSQRRAAKGTKRYLTVSTTRMYRKSQD